MDRGFILLIVAFMVCMATGVQGTSHLSFANNTEVNITRDGCGVTKLCVETPEDCNPTANSNCLFVSVVATPPVAPDGTNLSIELSGNSTGYIALGLTRNASEGTTMFFICAQNTSNNGSFVFRTVERNNANSANMMLNATERRVTEIRGTVNGDVIQCEFNIPKVNATNTRTSAATTFVILLGSGTFDGTNFGPFMRRFASGPLDLTNAASNIATTPAPSNATTNMTMATPMTMSTSMTMTSNTTTGSSGAVQPHAVLLLLSVLTLSIMLRA